MVHFWEYSVWGFLNILALLFISLFIANLLKKNIKFLAKSLIPTSVLGGLILLIVATVYHAITDEVIFDTEFFAKNGSNTLEIITYHALALGFIASTLRDTSQVQTKKRTAEIFNTGVTTVSTYLLQAVLGLGFTLLIGLVVSEFCGFSGVILPFGFGQGTGQALNYGTIYEEEYGFDGGAHFGLTVAALGFLSASIGGIIHLAILKKKGVITKERLQFAETYMAEDIQQSNEIPMNGSIDKLTTQIVLVGIVYFITYLFMYFVSGLVGDGLKLTIYGFNFLFGVLFATLTKFVMKILNNKGIVKRRYNNNFLLTRISNTCFDLMIVAGIAVIRLDYILEYWYILIALALIGGFSTYFYNRFIARKFFKEYSEEQFLAMYGMLTGTASTGILLLREVDPDFKTPVADNLIYQNLPAIVFGFPMMLLATLAPKEPIITLLILVGFFIVMNVILFRSVIFKKRSK